MNDEPIGGLVLPNNNDEDTPEMAKSVQINISLTPTNFDSAPLSTGVWIRSVFTDPQGAKKVRVSFVPDHSEHISSKNILDPTPGEKASFTKLLEDSAENFDIDTGTSIVRLANDEKSGVAIWIPNDPSKNIVTSYFTGVISEGEPGVSLKKFRKCMKTQKAQRRTYAEAFCECINQL